MSTALFLNVKHKLSKQQLLKIKDCFKQSGADDIAFRYRGKVKNIDGVNYYFDSMWIPFFQPLRVYEERKVDCYGEFVSIFKVIKEIINFLLNENQGIKLFHASVEAKEILVKGEEKLEFSEINEFKNLEWGTVYEIYK